MRIQFVAMMMPFLKTCLLVSLPLYVLDQVTKWLIVLNFAPPQPELGFYDYTVVIDGFADQARNFFEISRVHNTGVAFGRFNGTAWANVAFTCVALTALFVICFLWRKGAFPVKASQWAVFLLIPGILGNLTDRLVHGYVVDFLTFDLGFMVWPSFNVADSCICVAAGLLFIAAFQKPPEPVDTAEAVTD